MTAYTPGLHLLADFFGVNASVLGDAAALQAVMQDAASAAEAHVVAAHFHHFGAGMGVTGMLLLRESHFSIHTWPETGLATLDIFMCGLAQPQRALAHLQSVLQPQHVVAHQISRGHPTA